MEKIKLLELFGGIRSPYKALINLGLNVESIDYVEHDPKVVDIANKIYNTNYKPKSVVGYSIDKKIDLLIGGSPCQDFSTAGLQKGGEKGSQTRSSLIWEQLRILKETMPKFYIWENVKGVLYKNMIKTFHKHNEFVKDLGYKVKYKLLNSKDFGIPQNRERVFVVAVRNDIINNFDFDNLKKCDMKDLKSFLTSVEDPWYFVKEKRNTKKETTGKVISENKGHLKINMYNFDNANNVNSLFENTPLKTITTQVSKSGSTEKILIPIKNLNDELLVVKWKDKLWNVRILNEIECWKLMGFTEKDFNKVKEISTRNKIYYVAGNSIVVQVLVAIFKELFKEWK